MAVTQSTKPAIWKPIPEYEGIYEVSNRGSIRSLDRMDRSGRRLKGRVLTPYTMPSGHLTVTLCKQGDERQVYIHRMVLRAFIGEAPPDTEACHWDGNPANNRVENLRWDTHTGNMQDRLRHGYVHTPRQGAVCMRGHGFVPENTILRPRGVRACRACTNTRKYCARRGIEFDSGYADRAFQRLTQIAR